MKRVNVIIIFTAFLISQQVLSQQVTKSIIGSAGQTQISESTRVTWALGEPVVGTMTGGGKQIGNGFLPSLDFSVLFVPEQGNMTSIEMYPNPATDFITCKTNSNSQLLIIVTGLDGKHVMNTTINSGDKIKVTSWKRGTYLMSITDLQTKLVTNYKVLVN